MSQGDRWALAGIGLPWPAGACPGSPLPAREQLLMVSVGTETVYLHVA